MSKRILVVEDDPVIQRLIIEFLEDEGFQVLAVSDGQAGVDAAQRTLPDLILMDLMLPVLDGMAATRAIKRDTRTDSIPVIAISAGTNLRIHAEQLPADGVVGKPFDLDTLLAAVTVHLQAAGNASEFSILP
jgi:DNA-binding response OmpR family regulator